MSIRRSARAFAPASVGNVGVGFDILGHALDAVGDVVVERPVRIAAVMDPVACAEAAVGAEASAAAVESVVRQLRGEDR